MQITRWSDETQNSLADIENLLLAVHPDESSDTSMGYANWDIRKDFDTNKKGKFNGKEIEYNFFTYSVDQIPVGAEATDDSVTKRTGFMLVYQASGKVCYVIDRNSGAKTLIRKMLFYTGKGEIARTPGQFSADKFVWLISKVYGGENILDGSDYLDSLNIKTIRGFKGDTEDFLTKISAEGESVMNIISTLSFLIESRNLHQISLDIAYRGHKNIGVTLNNKNTVFIDDERYLGELLQDCKVNERLAQIILILYIEVFPIIIQNYQNDLDSDLWSKEKTITFLNKVADDLAVKVKERINDLKTRPEQLSLILEDIQAEE